MANRQMKYLITAKENYGGRRTIFSSTKESEARKELAKLLAPPKSRIVNGKRIYLTSYRAGKSGTGINNPRFKKILGYK